MEKLKLKCQEQKSSEKPILSGAKVVKRRSLKTQNKTVQNKNKKKHLETLYKYRQWQ